MIGCDDIWLGLQDLQMNGNYPLFKYQSVPASLKKNIRKPEGLSIGALAGRSSTAARVSWSLSALLVVDDWSDNHDGECDDDLSKCCWGGYHNDTSQHARGKVDESELGESANGEKNTQQRKNMNWWLVKAKVMDYPGVKVLPSLHEQETLMPAPQGLFGLGRRKHQSWDLLGTKLETFLGAFNIATLLYLFNTRDLSRSLISLAVGI